jgi:hypothetical protein
MALSRTIPAAIAQSTGEGWVQWVTVTNLFAGKVVLREPLFGSNLTITQLLMSPPHPKFGDTAHFTAVIKNIGVITAWRWFAADLYIRPASGPPPQNAGDHTGATLLKRGGDFKLPPLGPSESITATATIKIERPGDYRAYAQVDVFYEGDPGHYSRLFGSNPEGYGSPPYPEERNVVAAQPFTVKGSTTYLPVVSRNSSQ